MVSSSESEEVQHTLRVQLAESQIELQTAESLLERKDEVRGWACCACWVWGPWCLSEVPVGPEVEITQGVIMKYDCRGRVSDHTSVWVVHKQGLTVLSRDEEVAVPAPLFHSLSLSSLLLQAIAKAASEMKALEATIAGLEEQLELARTTLDARTEALEAMQSELSATAAALEATRCGRWGCAGGCSGAVFPAWHCTRFPAAWCNQTTRPPHAPVKRTLTSVGVDGPGTMWRLRGPGLTRRTRVQHDWRRTRRVSRPSTCTTAGS